MYLMAERRRRAIAWLLAAATSWLLVGCAALSTEVAVSPLVLVPSDIRIASTIDEALGRGDYVRVIELGRSVGPESTRDSLKVAHAEVAAGRFAGATERLERALALAPSRDERRDLLWELSQAAYLENEYQAALDHAVAARDAGLAVVDWHIALLRELAAIEPYRHSGAHATTVPLHFESPSVPRVDARVNGKQSVVGIVDSGAILSIVSESLARELELRRLGDSRATFFGLVGDPIDVRFGIIDSLRIGDMTIESVPVAIMPDRKLSFVLREEGTYRVDLILGATLLKEFRLRFDYGRRRLRIEYLEPEERAPVANQNLFWVDARPFVRAAINRKAWYSFLLDTGSEITFLNGSRMRIADVPGMPKPHKATLQGLGGSQRHGTRVDDVEIGIDRWGGLFRHLPLYDDERSGAVGIVGQNFLRHFNVVVDFGRMRMELERR